MGSEIDFNSLDKKLKAYFEKYKDFICCREGCSSCCEKGDYPLSDVELKYLMKGYSSLDNSAKIKVQQNIKTMVKGGACPFLLEHRCAIYPYRPIVCRIHGLAYLNKDGVVKLPYCANEGKNFSNNYSNGEFVGEPIKENLDELMNIGEVRNLYDWLKTD